MAIITGGGRGIGFTIAESFARAGAVVVLGEMVLDRGQAAAQKLNDQGFSAAAYPLDVTRRSDCIALAEFVAGRYGRIDILINNAGVFIGGQAEDLSEADWRLQIDVMLTGPFLCAQAVARAAMLTQQHGSVINIASITATGGWPLRHAYNAAKAGLISLTHGLAVEWAKDGIRVNAISPGIIMTDMLRESLDSGLSTLDRYTHRIPMRRLGLPDEIAQAALFLASDRSRYITGHNLTVDGGWTPYGNPDALGYPEVGSGGE